MTNTFSPLVTDTTKAQSESLETILTRLRKKRVYIPDYQRDAEQWNDRKKSLFIESLLNNLTIPAFFFCEGEKRNSEVVDGQQRLNTIWQFADDNFTMSRDTNIPYIAPQSALYAGKNFSQLPQELQNIFSDYPLTIIYLPRTLPLQTKLEIFRRINEGGTPLSGQDIRLAYYSESKAVTFVRLVGIRDNPTHEETLEQEESSEETQKSSQRMLELGIRLGLSNPWDSYPDARDMWYDWWEGTEQAKGQTPSLMFLWYLVCLDRNKLDNLLMRNHTHLDIHFGGSVENALDIYCAQLKYQDERKDSQNILSSLETISGDYFKNFACWMESILSAKLPSIGANKYKQLALFIASAVELNILPENLSNEQWTLIGEFIRSPRKTSQKILADDKYPEPKGSWRGRRGQKQQCDSAVEIAQTILK